MADDIGGVWRTVGGRRIFIKDGDDLETAMRKSGKFKNLKKKKEDEEESNPRDAINYFLKKGEFEKAEQYLKDYGLEDEREEFMDGLNYAVQKDYREYLSSSAKSVKALNRIDNLADNAQHYTNDFNKQGLEKKGRQMGSKDFESYVDNLKHESYEKRNSYERGDTLEYNTNYHGVTEKWHQGEVLSVESGLAGHGDTRPDKIYKVKDLDNGNEYKIDAITVSKRIRRK